MCKCMLRLVEAPCVSSMCICYPVLATGVGLSIRKQYCELQASCIQRCNCPAQRMQVLALLGDQYSLVYDTASAAGVPSRGKHCSLVVLSCRDSAAARLRPMQLSHTKQPETRHP